MEDDDAEFYAGAFAFAKALGLGNADARAYASGVVYHSAVAASNSFPKEDDRAALADYATAFAEAVGDESPAPLADALGRASEAAHRNNWWPFSTASDPTETSFAEIYALAFEQTDADGVAAHVYASVYAGYVYSDGPDDRAATLADVGVRGYERSDSPRVEGKVEYSLQYRGGYLQAAWRAEPEQGYTDESHIYSWAAAFADAYGRGVSTARNNGWDNPRSAGYTYARLFAITKVDDGFSDQDAYANANAYFRGVHYATERGLASEAHDSYAWDYFNAYFDKKVWGAWPQDRAHTYASSYADAKLAGRSDADAETYAAAYEEAYTSQINDGATEDEARLYAAAFADAKLGS